MTHNVETLDLYLKEEGFSKRDLNKNNRNYVTPLSLALDSKRAHKYVDALLAAGANPVIPNARGYVPLQLARKDPELLLKIQRAIKQYTCSEIRAVEGSEFLHLGKKFRITRVIKGGSSSIKSLEIIELETNKTYILKIKHNFSGLEIRNYVSLGKYVDLFPIKKFILNELVFTAVHGLMQQIVPGVKLSTALKMSSEQANRDFIIYHALIALGKLHRRGFVHRDALPDNCHWDATNRRADFFDYDIMRNYYDLGAHNFSQAVLSDYKRLLFGCKTHANSQIKGLAYYTPNMNDILQIVPDKLLSPKNKARLSQELEERGFLSINAPKKLRMKQ